MTLPKMAPANILKLFAAFLFAAVLGMASTPARADMTLVTRPETDTVALTLSTEGWIEAATARVRIAVDSAVSGEQVANVRAHLKETLAKLIPNAEWHITGLDRSRDQAGLERWHLEAETRSTETALDGLYDRAKSESKPGEQVSVSDIDFTPTNAEREAVMAELRAKIYAAAKEELAKLSSIYPDRNYRLRSLDFGPHGPMPMVAPMASRAAPGVAMQASSAPAPIGVAERVELTANVVLAAEAPAAKKE